MRYAIYARESSKDTKSAPSINEQIEKGRLWLQQNQHELIRVYQDNGFSGGDWNRPDFNQLVKDAKNKNKQFNAIWIWSQDRIARDTELFLWFYRMMIGSHVTIHSEIEGEIDMDTLGGRIKHTSLAQASEIFRLMTSEKVRNAYASRVKKAKESNTTLKWGRKELKIDMDMVQKLKDEGKGWRTIAKELPPTELTRKDGSKKLVKVCYITIKNRWKELQELKGVKQYHPLSNRHNDPPKSTPIKNNPII